MIYSFYRSRDTKELITYVELRSKFSNISFPISPWPASVYDLIKYDPVIIQPRPILNDEYNIAVPDGYEQLEDGCWISKWKIEPTFKTKEELLEYENEKNRGNLEIKWTEIRSERNSLLTKTDFTQLADSPFDESIKLEFSKYRKLLRDITQQEDPYNINWPKMPIDF